MSTSAATAGPLGHLIERTLPQSARGVLLDVLALHVLSAELDRDLARGLEAGPISPGTCAEAHRRTGVFADRRRQIDLIVRIGERVARTVGQPLDRLCPARRPHTGLPRGVWHTAEVPGTRLPGAQPARQRAAAAQHDSCASIRAQRCARARRYESALLTATCGAATLRQVRGAD